jgi:diamine N-acetyltransferase
MISLKGKRVKLRTVEPADVDILFEWDNDPALMKYGLPHEPYGRELVEQYVARAQDDFFSAHQLRLMIETTVENLTIGHIDLSDLEVEHLRAAVGLAIPSEEHRNKGWGAEALQLVCEYADVGLHLKQLYAQIQSWNSQSLQMFKKQGFTEAGRLKSWHRTEEGYEDVIWVQKIFEN